MNITIQENKIINFMEILSQVLVNFWLPKPLFELNLNYDRIENPQPNFNLIIKIIIQAHLTIRWGLVSINLLKLNP